MCCRVLTSSPYFSFPYHTYLCLYRSYHRSIMILPIPSCSTTYLLWENGKHPQRTNLEDTPPLQHRIHPTSTSKARHYGRPLCILSTHKHVSLQCLYPVRFYSSFALAARALLSQNTRKTEYLRRGISTCTSHLRPSSRRRMPALATHISAPNLLFAPTTSISTNLLSRGRQNRDIQVFG